MLCWGKSADAGKVGHPPSVGSELDSKVREMWSHAVSGKRRDFGYRVFSYWVQKLDGPDAATLWGFLVYEGVAFVAFTGPSS
jgi:hypothetical protein